MKDLFYQGGAGFMGVLTLLLLALVVWNVYHFIVFVKSGKDILPSVLRKFRYGRDIGLFAMVTGFMGQMVGMFAAFSILQEVDDVSPSVLAGGFRVSLIAPLYGILIYLLALLVWFVMTSLVERKINR